MKTIVSRIKTGRRLKIKTAIINSFIFVILLNIALPGTSQVPKGFNYQAIARDASKNPITSPIGVRFSIQSDSLGGSVFWVEEHPSVTPNEFGVFNLVIGKSGRVSGLPKFSDIDWTVNPKFIKTEINYGGWKLLGSSRLWSVPYAMVADSLGAPLKKLQVKGVTTLFDEPLFEVKNNNGQTVFAVYNEGVRVFVDDGKAKGAKGGFSVGGFGTDKAGESQPYLKVYPDSVRIFIDETSAKGSKGGFAVGGFNSAKGTTNEFMMMTPDNYFIGHSSGELVNLGVFNSTLGYQSGKNLTDGSQNVFMGYQSGYTNSTGNANIFIGSNSGYTNSTGYWNILLGRDAGYFNQTGHANIIVGDWAGKQNTVGNNNVMIGDYSGGQNTSGSSNVFIGASSGFNNQSGEFNTYLGYNAGFSGTGASGSNNIFMGVEAGYSNTTGFDNVAIGNEAGRSNQDGTYNVLIGSSAGNLNVSGDYNTMVGYKAGENHTGNYATLLGYLAGNSTTSGNSQTMVGYEAGSNNTGQFNTLVGVLAGGNSSTGSDNTYLGLAAGNEAPGSRNVFIGKWAGWREAGSDKLIIENNYDLADNLNNALIYGDFSTKFLKVNGKLMSSVTRVGDYAADFSNYGQTGSWGIKILAGNSTSLGNGDLIDCYNGAGVYRGSISLSNGILQLTQVSDERLKENIKDTDMRGLQILRDIKLVDYNYSKSPEVMHTGYLAQDVKKILPEMVSFKEKEDVYTVSYTTLIPVLHKAIQEQQEIIDKQNAEIQVLKSRLEQIEALLIK